MGLRGLRGGRRGLPRGLWQARLGVRGRPGESSNRDIQGGGVPSWLRSSSSCMRRAKMSDTELRSSEASITVVVIGGEQSANLSGHSVILQQEALAGGGGEGGHFMI